MFGEFTAAEWLAKKALNPRVWIAIILLVLLSYASYRVCDHFYDSGKAAQVKVDAKALQAKDGTIADLNKTISNGEDIYRQSLLDSAKIQNDWSTKLQTAEAKANEAQTKLNIATAANAAAVSVLDQATITADSRASLPETATATLIDYIHTADDVFRDCSAKYRDLAEQAGKLEIDKQKLSDAYPVSESPK